MHNDFCMSTRTTLTIFVILLIFLGVGFWYYQSGPGNTYLPPNGGTPPPTTTPGTPSDNVNHPLIRVTSPVPNTFVTSPLTISGEAKGTWYFEASFPVRLVDGNGQELALKPAQAQGDWMTENFVPFQVTLTFTQPTTPTGTLILMKDNPSGLPENDDEIRIPVQFQQSQAVSTSKPSTKDGCVVGGCSGEVCADKEMASACIYKPEFACYRTATCEKQKNGACGWTQTKELASCLIASTNAEATIAF